MPKPFPKNVFVTLSDEEKARAQKINSDEYHGALRPTTLVHEIFRCGLAAIEKGYLATFPKNEDEKPKNNT